MKPLLELGVLALAEQRQREEHICTKRKQHPHIRHEQELLPREITDHGEPRLHEKCIHRIHHERDEPGIGPGLQESAAVKRRPHQFPVKQHDQREGDRRNQQHRPHREAQISLRQVIRYEIIKGCRKKRDIIRITFDNAGDKQALSQIIIQHDIRDKKAPERRDNRNKGLDITVRPEYYISPARILHIPCCRRPLLPQMLQWLRPAGPRRVS